MLLSTLIKEYLFRISDGGGAYKYLVSFNSRSIAFYLLQAVASELINHLNSHNQTLATVEAVEIACTKVLKSSSAYFSDMWRNGNSEIEQTLMRSLALGQALELDVISQSAINQLIRKEIIIKIDQGYQLAIELFARWIINNQC